LVEVYYLHHGLLNYVLTVPVSEMHDECILEKLALAILLAKMNPYPRLMRSGS
jgi:hypothetical protein